VITNQREYRITKGWIARFEKELVANETRELRPREDPGMRKVVHDAIASEIETLQRQIDHYERLRDGHITSREITSLRDLPSALIEAAHRRPAYPAPARRAHRRRRAADPALGGQRLQRRGTRPATRHRRRTRRADPRDDHIQ
jgi:hypothetical protein